jgi:hypothetical protein
MLILPASLEHDWADQLTLLWAARRERRLRPPIGPRRRRTDRLYCFTCCTWHDKDAFWRVPAMTRGYDNACKACRTAPIREREKRLRQRAREAAAVTI